MFATFGQRSEGEVNSAAFDDTRTDDIDMTQMTMTATEISAADETANLLNFASRASSFMLGEMPNRNLFPAATATQVV